MMLIYDVKPSKRVFKTKRITIRRSKDPRTFKCSVCDTHMSSLKELNAHFITNHRRVSCDICVMHMWRKILNLSAGAVTRCSLLRVNSNHTATCIGKVGIIYVLYQTVEKHSNILETLCLMLDLMGKLLKCVHCSYANPDIRNLKSHLRTHSRVTPFRCKLCGECFIHSN